MALPTYQDYLDAGNDPLFAQMQTGRTDGRVKHNCECDSWDWAFNMQDIRTLPDHLTEGQQFTCGNCFSRWWRARKPIRPGDDFLHKSEWRIAWATEIGDALDMIRALKVIAVDKLERVAIIQGHAEQKYQDAINGGNSDEDVARVRDQYRGRRRALEARATQIQATIGSG